ncbi:pyridoxamine 5'-phosphate oxidase family protein [Chelativorans intermedius]|uniref:Pyridoxamine 5'-phosphate oxidase family protein n=1 Tax=Chelativorans intermedius TaxID=515947 RepID=A0ABV6DAC2_9HYPH|nr:pyridoxamine 5'-phosphate oxidase family protein [Chelativorans intermedius]MCT9000093.1 pyridoxamine 5'-phosphate oxidase family protein [Chelativorans intermedius]
MNAEAGKQGRIETVEELESLYGRPARTALVKEIDHIIPCYEAFIRASPFVALATAGPEGLDCSPRGDRPGFVHIHDSRTLMMPDRRGNNRVDSLRNIVRDGRVGLLFLVPGSGTTLRVNGRAHLSADPALCLSLATEGKSPRSVIVIHVESIYFQCARAIQRSRLWSMDAQADATLLPTPGDILAQLSGGDIDGATYDAEWPARAAKTMW